MFFWSTRGRRWTLGAFLIALALTATWGWLDARFGMQTGLRYAVYQPGEESSGTPLAVGIVGLPALQGEGVSELRPTVVALAAGFAVLGTIPPLLEFAEHARDWGVRSGIASGDDEDRLPRCSADPACVDGAHPHKIRAGCDPVGHECGGRVAGVDDG